MGRKAKADKEVQCVCGHCQHGGKWCVCGCSISQPDNEEIDEDEPFYMSNVFNAPSWDLR